MRIAWSRELSAPPLGLSLARESGALLLFDAERMLTRLDSSGQVDLRRTAPATVTTVAFSDEGRHIAALGRRGQVWLLSAQFDVIWQRSLSPGLLALAIDHLGGGVAVADSAGGLHVFDAQGQERWFAETPRPLRHLAYVHEAGALVGSADLGLVCAFDRRGQSLWRDGLMANVGSLAVSGDGQRIVLACFSEGLCTYTLDRPRQERLTGAGPCRMTDLAYRGEPIVCVAMEHRLIVTDIQGKPRGELLLPGAPAALRVSALGDQAALVVERKVLGVMLE